MTKPTLPLRYSGILLHPTSLPNQYGIGDFGKSAYDFVDFLVKAEQTIWQVLPMGPTGFGDSPYQSYSAFAGHPLLIDLDSLILLNLLTKEAVLENYKPSNPYKVDYDAMYDYKIPLLKMAYEHFLENTTSFKSIATAYRAFCKKEAWWLNDYALFMVLRSENGDSFWPTWPTAHRAPTKELFEQYRSDIGFHQFVQYLFASQWKALRQYANEKGILIVGDIPLYVSMDSSDVWGNPKLFLLKEDGYPSVVAGVPPDYFSETGQLWGNPIYDWKYHKKTNFRWWLKRIESQAQLFDYIRIDHFRGLESCWQIDSDEKTAINGKWVSVPGEALFNKLFEKYGKDIPIFAEDLGIITPEVETLRDKFDLPGMKVLQFAFDNIEDNNLLPHHFTTTNSICYTGTHDNDTSLGWYLSASEEVRDRLRRYLNSDGNSIHMDMIRTALSSVAKYAVFPLQDLLGYGSDCRMNIPGVLGGNWAFRFTADALTDEIAQNLASLIRLYGRDSRRYIQQLDNKEI